MGLPRSGAHFDRPGVGEIGMRGVGDLGWGGAAPRSHF